MGIPTSTHSSGGGREGDQPAQPKFPLKHAMALIDLANMVHEGFERLNGQPIQRLPELRQSSFSERTIANGAQLFEVCVDPYDKNALTALKQAFERLDSVPTNKILFFVDNPFLVGGEELERALPQALVKDLAKESGLALAQHLQLDLDFNTIIKTSAGLPSFGSVPALEVLMGASVVGAALRAPTSVVFDFLEAISHFRHAWSGVVGTEELYLAADQMNMASPSQIKKVDKEVYAQISQNGLTLEEIVNSGTGMRELLECCTAARAAGTMSASRLEVIGMLVVLNAKSAPQAIYLDYTRAVLKAFENWRQHVSIDDIHSSTQRLETLRRSEPLLVNNIGVQSRVAIAKSELPSAVTRIQGLLESNQDKTHLVFVHERRIGQVLLSEALKLRQR